MRRAVLAAFLVAAASASRDVFLLDYEWKVSVNDPYPGTCPANIAAQFTRNLTGYLCNDMVQWNSWSEQSCAARCCADASCQGYVYIPNDNFDYTYTECYIGSTSDCSLNAKAGTVGAGRTTTASPSPAPGPGCNDPACNPSTDDSSWTSVNLPHDFVVGQNFTQDEDVRHGYLPLGQAWYRKHISFPASAKGAESIWIDFEAIQTTSVVYFNGQLLGTKGYGYTNSRYFLSSSQINWSGDNVLAVFVDASFPDSWWYDGGGIYRHVWLTVVTTPGPYIAPWGVYAPSNVTGSITFGSDGTPHAAAVVFPTVEVWSNVSSSQAFSLALTVTDAAGNVVGSSSGSGSVSAGTAPVVWASPVISIASANLWHLVDLPTVPSLYTLSTVLTVGGVAVDTKTVTFGIRQLTFDAATGFYLNGVATKIKGTANHQDAQAFGVAVPDHVQTWRINKLKEMGVNGWRTAHNPPNPGLLEAADAVGFLVWDETHRNGNLPELELLIKRDRNHPSVIIWSLCNEILCNTNNWVADALSAKALIKTLDPFGHRPVSANQNGWIGPNTPLDLQGFDYNTNNYDQWHAQAPNIPSISSETSSAYSDRGVFANNAAEGWVSGYDVNWPGWGETTQMAWGGINVANGQGILTRPFICGGWTWTGHDYRGEPTPYGWPDVNSNFGIIDAAGFPKDRFYWYQSWFIPATPIVHLFPHWNWASGDKVTLWAYSNADSVELIVNGKSLGTQYQIPFSHVEWDNVPWVAGTIQAIAYNNGSSTPVATHTISTTGPAAALAVSVQDGVGQTLVAGCADVAFIQVAVVDSNGVMVPTANNNVTFSVSGAGVLVGTANGNPSGHVNNLSPMRPAFNGLMMGVVQAGDVAGVIKVVANSPGLAPASLVLTVQAQPADFSEYWCKNQPRL